MDRTILVARVLLVASIAGLALLAIQYTSPIEEPPPPAIVNLPQGRGYELRSPLPRVAIRPSPEDAGDLPDGAVSESQSSDAAAEPPTTSDLAQSPAPPTPTTPVAVGADDLVIPPLPTRPQLALAANDDPTLRNDLFQVALQGAEAIDASILAADLNMRERASASAAAVEVDLRAANLAETVMTYIRMKDEPGMQRRVTAIDDGLRWRDVFTYHLEPQR